MADMQNKIRLDFRGNKELAEVFAGKKAGDKCKFMVELMVDEMDGDGATGSIEKVIPHGYESSESKEKDIVPDEVSPVMMVIAKGKAPKKEKAEKY